MPKLIDYSARFEFLRQAAFARVRDHGPEGLSRRSVAEVLGMSESTVRRLVDASAPLTDLAADEVTTRWQRSAWGRPRPPADATALDTAVHLVAGLLPGKDTATHVVWLRLALARRSVSRRAAAPGDDDVPLASQVQIAERGWAEPIERSGTSEEHPEEAPAAMVRDRHQAEQAVLRRALDLLGAGESTTELALLSALVHGLALDICLGTVDPDVAVFTVRGHLERPLAI